MTTFAKDLKIAQSIARQAGAAALNYWRREIRFTSKPDDSPVTDADREAERVMTALFETHLPEDGLLGEEGAMKESHNGRRWIIDPVDGTRDFIRGEPGWAVLIGLEAGGVPSVGVCYFPVTDEMYCGARGLGAFRNQDRLQVSGASERSRAVLCASGLADYGSYPFAADLLDWISGFWSVRSRGGCVDAVSVLRGQADVWLSPKASPWDLVAFRVMAEEAGGRFFDFAGRDTIHGGNAAIVTPGLEALVRDFLGIAN